MIMLQGRVLHSHYMLCVMFQRMLINLFLKDVFLPVLALKNDICLYVSVYIVKFIQILNQFNKNQLI